MENKKIRTDENSSYPDVPEDEYKRIISTIYKILAEYSYKKQRARELVTFINHERKTAQIEVLEELDKEIHESGHEDGSHIWGVIRDKIDCLTN
ncbi:hypothetical protein NO1_0570 [Candidatus Termititenax aidoneus]|uniref:Uncharacterized protein n=1 Tax=Termititenax aidoneus TaxID=2218524 RepID=A0A388TAI2_TERA1|nr:hypothetical protein NO1_0570 [Candidatus Termititenax aidoneus]